MTDERREPNGTTTYRIGVIERELEIQRDRTHNLISESAALRLSLQRATDEIEHLEEHMQGLREELRYVKRALWGVVFTVLTGMLLFLVTVAFSGTVS